MTAAELLVIVPTRSRPQNIRNVIDAWQETGAFEDGAKLLFVRDNDDPARGQYTLALEAGSTSRFDVLATPSWRPLVPKLNAAAVTMAEQYGHFAIGFAGDDHLPRTRGWARRYIDELRRVRTGIVYCDDGYQGENLPTQWAMTSDIITALRKMVPAPVDHLYCDNAVQDLGRAAGSLSYLGDVLIEHMHPVAKKAASDEQYERVNSREQYKGDRRAYHLWRQDPAGLAAQAEIVRGLIERGAAA